MQCRAELGHGQAGAVDVVAVGLVDDDAVGHLHDAALDSLELVAGAGKLDEQEEVDHRVDGGLALSYADGFDEDVVEPGGFTEHDGLAGLACHAAETAGRGGRAHEGAGMHRQALHTSLVAENRAFGALRRWVDGQHGQFGPGVLEDMKAEDVD